MEYCLIVHCKNEEKIGNILNSNEESTYNDLTENDAKLLSPLEYNYYSKINKNERVKLYKSNFLRKLKELRVDDICSVEINGILTKCKLRHKTLTDNKLLLTFEVILFYFYKI